MKKPHLTIAMLSNIIREMELEQRQLVLDLAAERLVAQAACRLVGQLTERIEQLKETKNARQPNPPSDPLCER